MNEIIKTIEKNETFEDRYGFKEKMRSQDRKRYKRPPATREEINVAMVDYLSRGGKITKFIEAE